MTFKEYLRSKGYTDLGCEAVDLRIKQNISTYEDRRLYQSYLFDLEKAKADNKGAAKRTARAAGSEPESIIIKDYQTFKHCVIKSCEQDEAAERDYKYDRALGELVCRDRNLYREYEDKLREDHKNDRARLLLDLDVNTTEGS